MIRDGYKDKQILLTGITGFVGKVLIEKFFYDMPDIKRIYLLIRPKRGTKAMDRVRKDIFSSQCFDRIREKYGSDFDQKVIGKIVPIEGDMTKPGLALKPEDKELLVNNLDIIINCAASVDFNERLCDAIQINYYGGLRMMELASACKNL